MRRPPPSTSSLFPFGMFHRRLIVVGVLVALAFVAIGARLVGLTVVEGDERLAEAESRLGRSRLLPTIRGRIVDRKGRVLAEDAPAYGLAIEFEAIDGTWVRDEARRLARREIGRSNWNSLTPRGRELSTESKLPAAQARLSAVLDEACSLAGMPRGELDAKLAEIRDSVLRRATVVHARQRERWIERYGADAAEQFGAEPIDEQRRPHEVVSDLGDGAAFSLRRLADEAPGILEVTDSVRRIRPWSKATVIVDRSTLPTPIRHREPISIEIDGIAEAIVGRCGSEVWREDLERRPFSLPDGGEDLGGYRPGADIVGRSGIECSFEDVLRGRRGRVTTRVDSGDEARTQAIPGTEVRLALDIALQARVEALLDPRVGLTMRQDWHDAASAGEDERGGGLGVGTALAAAAVVIDVDRGEIL
ncbi:MAG: hypothetical protein FJ253_12340, partial [Phycisphaerae bacterium]|nr:hypothetical protein [Phycisphaerae bacterium]